MNELAGAGGGGAGWAVTTAVAAEVAVWDPPGPEAVIAARTVTPTSAAASVYELEVAPEMAEQLLPDASQRFQTAPNDSGWVPVHEPLETVSVCPC